MKTSDLSKLQYYIDTLPSKLNAFTEEEFAHKTAPDKWSKKEIVGHLIDSATNNHHRFVKGSLKLILLFLTHKMSGY